MSAAFNLTAQLNLRGPNNVKKIVSDIKKQLGTVQGQVNLKINASSAKNISKLNAALQNLNTNLSNVSANAASATNAINLFTSSANNVNAATSNAAASTTKVAAATQSLGKNTAVTAKQLAVARTEMQEFGRQSALAIRRFAAFSAVTGIIFSVTGAIRKGVGAFLEFEKSFVAVQQVTGKSGAELKGLNNEVSKLSVGLGISSLELINVAQTLAQAGLSANETQRALKALALSNLAPTFDDLNNTVEGSIALIRQFGISANDLEASLGSVNAVAAAFAVESGDIISAIQRTGGVFAAASKGVSQGKDALNEFISVFTSVRQTTRESAETIATGLRTIFTRIQRGDTIEALREFGVELTDAEGKFVGAYKAIGLLSEGLGRLDPRDVSFSRIVEELGGFRQIGKVIPLIQQFAVAQEALKVAQGGQGSLAKDAITAQLSLGNQIAKVREEFLAFVRDVGSGDTFQTLAKTTLGFASGLIKVASVLKGVLPVLAILGLGKATSAATEFGSGFIGGLKKVKDDKGGPQQSLSSSLGAKLAGGSGSGSSTDLSKHLISLNASLSSNTSAISSLNTNMSAIAPSLQSFNSNITNLINSLNTLNNFSLEINNNTASTIANTSSIDALTTAILSIDFGSGPIPTIKDGGKILGFNRGGVVPGSGRGDKVPALLEPGEVVMSNSAVNKYGRGNLVKMNKYAIGGKAAYIADPNDTEYQSAHFGGDIPFTREQFIAYSKIYKNSVFQQSLREAQSKLGPKASTEKIMEELGIKVQNSIKLSLPRSFNQALKTGDPGLVDQNDLLTSIMSGDNLFKNFTKKTQLNDDKLLRSNIADAIKKLNTKKTKDYEAKYDVSQLTNQDLSRSVFDEDRELNTIKNTILQSVSQKEGQRLLDNIDILFKSPKEDLQYRQQSRVTARQSNLFATGGKIQKFMAGSPGGITIASGKGRGVEGPKGARSYIDPISSETYLKWAKGIYEEYDADPSLVMASGPEGLRRPPEIALADMLLAQYALETGGAGLSVGQKFVRTPSANITDELRPYLVPDPSDPNELGFFQDDVVKFGKLKKIPQQVSSEISQRKTTSKMQRELFGFALEGVAKSVRDKTLTKEQLEALSPDVLEALSKDPQSQVFSLPKLKPEVASGSSTLLDTLKGPLSEFRKSGGQTSLSGVIPEAAAKQIEAALPGYIDSVSDDSQKLSKAKTTQKYFRSFVGGGTAEKPGHATAFAETINQMLKSGSVQGLANGGMVQRFMAGSRGGVAPSLSSMTDVATEFKPGTSIPNLIKQISDIGGSSFIRENLGVDKIQEILNDKIKSVTKPPARKLIDSRWLGSSRNNSDLYIPAIQEIIKQARVIFDKQQLSKKEQIDRNQRAEAGDVYQFGLASIYGPNGELGYSGLSDAKEIETKDGQKLNTQIVRRSLPKRYEDDVQKTRQDIAALSSKAAERFSYTTIFGAKGPLAFDFDDTLVKNADIFDKDGGIDIEGYNDLAKVQEALKNAELTLLGKELKRRVGEDQKLSDNIRVLTARPQSNAPYLASTLSRLELPIPESKITGVSGGLNKVNNLSELETLIDDNLENIQSVTAGGKRAIPYREPRDLDLSNPSSLRSMQVMEGYTLENMVRDQTGINITPDDALDDPLKPIDFPRGLGAYASMWNMPPNIPTDTKRSNTSSAASVMFNRAEKFYNDNLVPAFAFGGKADGPGFEEIRQQIIDKYPEIDFGIRKRKKSSGFGYNLTGALKATGGLSGKDSVNFQQPTNLKQLQEYADKLAGKLMNPEEFAIGGLAEATGSMQSLMSGLYGDRQQQQEVKKQQKIFGQIALRDSGSRIQATYIKEGEAGEARSGQVIADKVNSSIYAVQSSSATKGYGPKLYDVVMEAATAAGGMLTSDRRTVSSAAKAVWAYYFNNRSDVNKTPLDPENWVSNSRLLDEKLYGPPGTWPQATDPAWILQSGYSKAPSDINNPDLVVKRFSGGLVNSFASGGTVPAMVSNGEAFVPPQVAKKIGYSKLDKMNQADRNGMTGFAGGGISVFKGSGSGTSDSIGPIGLPTGSYILREKATKALSLSSGGPVGIQRFATGGTPAFTDDERSLVAARAKSKGISFDAEVKAIKEALLTTAKTIQDNQPKKDDFRVTAIQNKQSLKDAQTTISTSTDATEVQQAQKIISDIAKDFASRLADIDPSMSESERDTTGQQVAQRLSSGEEFSDILKTLPELTQAFDRTINDATALGEAQRRLEEETGYSASSLSSLAEAGELSSRALQKANWDKIENFTKSLSKAAFVVSGFSSILSSAISGIGGEENRGSVTASAGIQSFGTTAGAGLATIAQVPGAVKGVIDSLSGMGGKIGSAASTIGPKIMGLLANPFTAAAALIGVAAVGIAAGFKEAHNAAREFDKALSAKNAQNAMDKVAQAFEEFANDMKALDLLDVIETQLTIAGENISRGIQIDAEVPKAMWVNLFDALTAGQSGNNRAESAQRSQILERQGVGAYLNTSSTFMGQEAADANRSSYMRRMAPEMAQSQAASFKPVADATLRLFEDKLKTGTNLQDILSELKIGDAPSQLAENIARANPVIQEQILNIQASNNLDENSKKSIINEIIAREANYKSLLQLEVAQRQIDFEALNDASSRFVTSLQRMFDNMDRSINKTSFELDDMSRSAQLVTSSLSGQAQSGMTNLKSINVLQNQEAFSPKERASSVDQAAGLFGSGSEILRSMLQIAPKMEQTVLSTINNVLKRNPGANDEQIAGGIRVALDKALDDLGLPPDLSNKMSLEVQRAFSDLRQKGDKDIGFDELAEKVPALGRSISSAKAAQEVAIRALEFFQKNINEYAQAVNTNVELQVQANDLLRKTAQIQYQGQLDLKKAFGRTVSLEETRKATTIGIQSQTGGLTDPKDITRAILRLEDTRRSEQSMADSAAQQGPGGMDEFVNMQDRLGKTNVALRENYDALKQLADSGELASAALSKIDEVEKKRAAGISIIEKLVTSDAAELNKFSNAMARLQNNMAGNANFGTSAEQRGESLQAFNMIAPMLGDQQGALKANVLESMLKESGVGVDSTMQEVLNSLRNPEGDPQMQEAINIYKEGVGKQAEANSMLAKLNDQISSNNAEVAANKLSKALVGTTLDFKSQQLKDINDNITSLRDEVKQNRNAGAPGLALGGMVYASEGQQVQFKSRGTDTVPAMLTPGEFVVNRSATAKNLPLLQNINNGYSKGGKVSYYQDGGVVVGPSWIDKQQDSLRRSSRDELVAYSSEKIPGFKDTNIITDNLGIKNSQGEDIVEKRVVPLRSSSIRSSGDIKQYPAHSIAVGKTQGAGRFDPYKPSFGVDTQSVFGYGPDSISVMAGGPSSQDSLTSILKINGGSPSSFDPRRSISGLGTKVGEQFILPDVDNGRVLSKDKDDVISGYEALIKKLEINTKAISQKDQEPPKISPTITGASRWGEPISINNLSKNNTTGKILAVDSRIDTILTESHPNLIGFRQDTASGTGYAQNFALETLRYGTGAFLLELAEKAAGSYQTRGSTLDTSIVSGPGLMQNTASRNDYGGLLEDKTLSFSQAAQSNSLEISKIISQADSIKGQIKASIDLLKLDKFTDQSERDVRVKDYFARLEELYNNNIFEASFEEQLPFNRGGIKYPIKLYNITDKNKWQRMVKDSYVVDAEAIEDENKGLLSYNIDDNYIPLSKLDQAGNITSTKHFPWTSPKATTKLQKRTTDAKGSFQKDTVLTSTSEPKYTGLGSHAGIFDFPYTKITGQKYNPTSRSWENKTSEYLAVSNSGGDKNPFSNLDGEKIYFDNITTLTKILNDNTPLYDVATQTTPPLAKGNIPYTYPFKKSAAGSFGKTESIPGLETNEIYQGLNDSVKPFVLSSDFSNISDFTLNATKFKEDKEKRIKDFAKTAREQRLETAQTQTLSKKEKALTPDVRIAMAQAVRDAAMQDADIQNLKLTLNKPTDINQIASLASGLNSVQTRLGTNQKDSRWRTLDSWRSLFSTLYKPNQDGNSVESIAKYFKTFGVNLETPEKAKATMQSAIKNIILREKAIRLAGTVDGSIAETDLQDLDFKGGKLYRTRTDPKTGELVKEPIEEAARSLPASYADVETIALTPENIFPDEKRRSTYIDKLTKYFVKQNYPNEIIASSQNLKKWYGTTQDRLINEQLDEKQLNNSLVEINGNGAIKNDRDLYQRDQQLISGTRLGELPYPMKMMDMINSLLEDKNNPQAAGATSAPPTKLASGGMVYASKGKYINFQPKGTDTVPAMLTPGEFVINKSATQRNLPLLQSINDGSQAYSRGGVVYAQQGGTIGATQNNSDLLKLSSNITKILKDTALLKNNDKDAKQNISQIQRYTSQIVDPFEISNIRYGIEDILDMVYQLFEKEGETDQISNVVSGSFDNRRQRAADRREVEISVNKNKGGIIYANSGQLIPYSPKGTDTVPAMLTPGEFVVNRAASQKNLPLLKNINSGTQEFAKGGIVYAKDGMKIPELPNARTKSDRLRDNASLPSQTGGGPRFLGSSPRDIYLEQEREINKTNLKKYFYQNRNRSQKPSKLQAMEELSLLNTKKDILEEESEADTLRRKELEAIIKSYSTKPQGYFRGGPVYADKGKLINFQARGTDTVPAMLTPGEFVVNRSATKNNLGLLQSINSGTQEFSNGGIAYLQEGGLSNRDRATKLARMGAPSRINKKYLDPITGSIDWPMILKDNQYEDSRKPIEKAFSDVSLGSGVELSSYQNTNATFARFISLLRNNVKKYPAGEYGSSVNFLDSLKREYEIAAKSGSIGSDMPDWRTQPKSDQDDTVSGEQSAGERAAKLARASAPSRINRKYLDPNTGKITWPMILKDSQYSSDRTPIEQVFSTIASGVGVESSSYENTNATFSRFRDTLRRNVKKYPAGEYGSSANFLDSLKREYEIAAKTGSIGAEVSDSRSRPKMPQAKQSEDSVASSGGDQGDFPSVIDFTQNSQQEDAYADMNPRQRQLATRRAEYQAQQKARRESFRTSTGRDPQTGRVGGEKTTTDEDKQKATTVSPPGKYPKVGGGRTDNIAEADQSQFGTPELISLANDNNNIDIFSMAGVARQAAQAQLDNMGIDWRTPKPQEKAKNEAQAQEAEQKERTPEEKRRTFFGLGPPGAAQERAERMAIDAIDPEARTPEQKEKLDILKTPQEKRTESQSQRLNSLRTEQKQRDAATRAVPREEAIAKALGWTIEDSTIRYGRNIGRYKDYEPGEVIGDNEIERRLKESGAPSNGLPTSLNPADKEAFDNYQMAKLKEFQQKERSAKDDEYAQSMGFADSSDMKGQRLSELKAIRDRFLEDYNKSQSDMYTRDSRDFDTEFVLGVERRAQLQSADSIKDLTLTRPEETFWSSYREAKTRRINEAASNRQAKQTEEMLAGSERAIDKGKKTQEEIKTREANTAALDATAKTSINPQTGQPYKSDAQKRAVEQVENARKTNQENKQKEKDQAAINEDQGARSILEFAHQQIDNDEKYAKFRDPTKIQPGFIDVAKNRVEESYKAAFGKYSQYPSFKKLADDIPGSGPPPLKDTSKLSEAQKQRLKTDFETRGRLDAPIPNLHDFLLKASNEYAIGNRRGEAVVGTDMTVSDGLMDDELDANVRFDPITGQLLGLNNDQLQGAQTVQQARSYTQAKTKAIDNLVANIDAELATMRSGLSKEEAKDPEMTGPHADFSLKQMALEEYRNAIKSSSGFVGEEVLRKTKLGDYILNKYPNLDISAGSWLTEKGFAKPQQHLDGYVKSLDPETKKTLLQQRKEELLKRKSQLAEARETLTSNLGGIEEKKKETQNNIQVQYIKENFGQDAGLIAMEPDLMSPKSGETEEQARAREFLLNRAREVKNTFDPASPPTSLGAGAFGTFSELKEAVDEYRKWAWGRPWPELGDWETHKRKGEMPNEELLGKSKQRITKLAMLGGLSKFNGSPIQGWPEKEFPTPEIFKRYHLDNQWRAVDSIRSESSSISLSGKDRKELDRRHQEAFDKDYADAMNAGPVLLAVGTIAAGIGMAAGFDEKSLSDENLMNFTKVVGQTYDPETGEVVDAVKFNPVGAAVNALAIAGDLMIPFGSGARVAKSARLSKLAQESDNFGKLAKALGDKASSKSVRRNIERRSKDAAIRTTDAGDEVAKFQEIVGARKAAANLSEASRGMPWAQTKAEAEIATRASQKTSREAMKDTARKASLENLGRTTQSGGPAAKSAAFREAYQRLFSITDRATFTKSGNLVKDSKTFRSELSQLPDSLLKEMADFRGIGVGKKPTKDQLIESLIPQNITDSEAASSIGASISGMLKGPVNLAYKGKEAVAKLMGPQGSDWIKNSASNLFNFAQRSADEVGATMRQQAPDALRASQENIVSPGFLGRASDGGVDLGEDVVSKAAAAKQSTIESIVSSRPKVSAEESPLYEALLKAGATEDDAAMWITPQVNNNSQRVIDSAKSVQDDVGSGFKPQNIEEVENILASPIRLQDEVAATQKPLTSAPTKPVRAQARTQASSTKPIDPELQEEIQNVLNSGRFGSEVGDAQRSRLATQIAQDNLDRARFNRAVSGELGWADLELQSGGSRSGRARLQRQAIESNLSKEAIQERSASRAANNRKLAELKAAEKGTPKPAQPAVPQNVLNELSEQFSSYKLPEKLLSRTKNTPISEAIARGDFALEPKTLQYLETLGDAQLDSFVRLAGNASSPDKQGVLLKDLLDKAAETNLKWLEGAEGAAYLEEAVKKAKESGKVKADFTAGGVYKKQEKTIAIGQNENKSVRDHELAHFLDDTTGGFVKNYEELQKIIGAEKLDAFLDGPEYTQLVKGLKSVYSPKQIRQTPHELFSVLNQAKADERTAKMFSESKEAKEILNQLMVAKGYNIGGLVYASKGQLINFQPRGTDTVPAMLTPGEFVINRDSSSKYRPVLEAINNGNYSQGGIVSYLNNGGIVNPDYYRRGGQPTGSSGSSFDFAAFMQNIAATLISTIPSAIQKGFQGANSASSQQNTSNGVSFDSSILDKLNEFTNRLKSVADTLASLQGIPAQITVTGQHDINVVINGDSALNQLKPELQNLVMDQVKDAFQRLVESNRPVPSDQLNNPFTGN